jgi:hypothetical protein
LRGLQKGASAPFFRKNECLFRPREYPSVYELIIEGENLMEQITEYQTLTMFGTYSIAFALRSIGAILGIWLALRIANNIRMSDEDSMVSKILGTGFGVLTVMGAYYWQTAYFSLRANTANGLNELAASGTELAAGTQQFVANFATGNAVTSPGAPVIVFDLIVLAMIVGQIWMPKKG